MTGKSWNMKTDHASSKRGRRGEKGGEGGGGLVNVCLSLDSW